METYLMHHGRLGQRWGKKNGPPYPLDFDKLSEKERALAKEQVIFNGDVKNAARNVKHFTNEEIDKVVARFEKNKKLEDLASKDEQKKIEAGKKKVEKLIKTMENIEKVTKATAGTAKSLKEISDLIGLTTKQPNNKKK